MTQSINAKAAGGTGLLAIFVDLDPDDRPGFRPFLAEDMFPARRNIGLGPAASYDRVGGEGQQFLTLYVAPSLGDLYGVPYQSLRHERGERDAMYHQKFRNQDRFVAAWTGPEVSSSNPQEFAMYLQVDRFDVPDDQIQQFNIWFACDYLPSLAARPGVISARRYVAVEGSPANVVLHELADLSALQDRSSFHDGGEVRSLISGIYERQL